MLRDAPLVVKRACDKVTPHGIARAPRRRRRRARRRPSAARRGLRRSAHHVQGLAHEPRDRDGPARRGRDPRSPSGHLSRRRDPLGGNRRVARPFGAPLDHRSARRHHELRARSARVRRVDRARGRASHYPRCRLRSVARRAVRGRARPRRHPRRCADPRLGECLARREPAHHRISVQHPRHARHESPGVRGLQRARARRAPPGLRRARSRLRRVRPFRRLLGAAAGRVGRGGGEPARRGGRRDDHRHRRRPARRGRADARGQQRPRAPRRESQAARRTASGWCRFLPNGACRDRPRWPVGLAGCAD